MSIEVEINGKAGRVCQQALAGKLHCPLIVRQSSEDVVTGNVFGNLRHIRPHLWLSPLLNIGLGASRFRQVWFKSLDIRLWERQEKFPPELLAFREGRTEPDIIIEWENPPTTIWIEAKFHSPIAEKTANCDQNDQVFRGIRTLLASTGHLQAHRLFRRPKREAIWLALLSQKPDPMVLRCSNPLRIRKYLQPTGALSSLPTTPFVGTLTWRDVHTVLRHQKGQMNVTEKSMADRLMHYLDCKV